jgi:uncharacterized repeat protein (TIGR02543 family)
MFINSSGTWKNIKEILINSVGTWKRVTEGLINVSGTWKRFFSSSLKIAQTVQIAQSTNATTFLTTLTGTNYYWSPGPPVLTYKFQRSTNGGSTWSDLDSGSIVNPAFGSSNTKTYLLPSTGPNVGVLPNVLNYYRFRVDATYGSLSSNSISSSTTIQGPTNTTISLANPTFASVELSWTASTGANRYLVYKSTDNITFSEYASVPSGTTSIFGISDLAGGSTYYFYVVPVTGGSFTNPGYYGNNSNTLTLPILATPTLSSATSQSSGFFFTINNYDASNTYNISTTAGSVSRSGNIVTVSGLSASQSATVTVSATRSGYGNSNSATRTGSALAQYTITWNPNGGQFAGGSTANDIDVGPIGTVTSPPSTPTRSGYTFLYWRDSAAGDFLYQVNSGGSWTIGTSGSTNVTFYARWQLITPTASNFARSDSTVTPSQPGTLSFSSSNNQVTTSWTNGSPITSVNFAASGAGVNTNYTDSSAPFITSDLSAYSSSGTYTATVTNFNNSLQVTVSWSQSNAQSYTISYNSSTFGSDSISGNNSGSSVSVPINWSSGAGSFTFQAVTLYTGLNQTGESNIFFTGLSAITPTQKSSSRSGSTSLTYSLPKLSTPTGVNASDNRTDGINVTWNAVSGAAYYGVWYGPTPSYDSTPDFQNITSTSYLDTSMGAGVTRNYYVQAFRSGNPAGTKSDWGGPDSGTRISSGTAPATPTNGGGTFSQGTNYITNATFTRSATGTTPITYYWSAEASTSSSGPWTLWNSGTISSSTLGGTQSIPQQSWNQALYGNWARYKVYAQNSVGTSGTLEWLL